MFRKRLIILMVLIFLLLVSFAPLLSLTQVVEEASTDTVQAKEESEKIVASPQNVKEETGIFVFVGWMWLCIIVLVSFLRLKIREADRLFLLKFFSDEEE